MTARARRRRDRECEGKVAHATADSALRARQVMAGKGVFVGTYRCPWCRQWHTGHRPAPRRRNRSQTW